MTTMTILEAWCKCRCSRWWRIGGWDGPRCHLPSPKPLRCPRGSSLEPPGSLDLSIKTSPARSPSSGGPTARSAAGHFFLGHAHAEFLGQGCNLQGPEPQQWQCRILNLLSYQGTPPTFLKSFFSLVQLPCPVYHHSRLCKMMRAILVTSSFSKFSIINF